MPNDPEKASEGGMMENGDGPVLLDRLSDRFFKYLFAKEEHKDLLIAFLNEVLLDLNPDGSARWIEDVTYGDRESSPLYRDAKLPRFDVIARSEDGRVFHIEVQVAKDPYFLERSLYYAAMTYSLQLRKGWEYHALMPVIFVGLLDFEVFPSTSRSVSGDEDYHSLHRILDVRDHRWAMKGMEFHFLELPKQRRRSVGPRTGLDRLLSYLGNVGGEPAMQELAQADSRVERMMQLESLFTRDPDLLRDYFIDLRDRLDYENSFKWARADGLEQGRAEGEARGEARGRAEGEARGEARGRAEGEARGRADTARNLLRMGLAPSQITEATGLSLDEIEALRDGRP